MENAIKKTRDSNLELFRILTMLAIVAHHYVVNSGLMWNIYQDYPSFKSIYLLILGWGGKTGINCFVLITGYYMCKSQITLKKGIKLLGEVLFYNIAVYFFFVIYGYRTFSAFSFLNDVFPFTSISDGFTSCYLIFFCFIPFLNVLVNNLTKKQHQLLLLLSFIFFSFLPALGIEYRFNYVGWFFVIFFAGSYLRLHQPFATLPLSKTALLFVLCLILSWLSVCVCSYAASTLHWDIGNSYFAVSDSNKPLAIVTAVFAFLFFKKIDIGHSKIINTIAASTFGVLLIHANSDTMRQWLWSGVLDNTGHYNGNIILHSVIGILLVYCICTLIDFLRIRYIESPFFRLFDSLFKH